MHMRIRDSLENKIKRQQLGRTILFCHPCSGSTWVETLLDHYDIKSKKVQAFGLQSPIVENEKLIYGSQLLIYLRRNPYDIYYSRIQRVLQEKLNIKNTIRDTPRKIILHHLSALDLAKGHPNFVLLDYEKLNSENGVEEFSKVCPQIDLKTWNDFSYENLQKKCEDEIFEQKYKFKLKYKFDGGLVGQGKKFLKAVQMDRLNEVIKKYDYWNKMSELDDLLL